MTMEHSEFGIRNSESPVFIPHSAFRIPNCVASIISLSVLGVLLWMPAAGWTCPGCNEALFDPGQLQQKLSTARGYALSIGVLLAVPFALVGGITALVIRASRKKPM